MTVKIEPLRPSDYPQWSSLFHKYCFHRRSKEEQSHHELMIQIWNQVFSEENPLEALVAKDELERVVAFIYYQKMPLAFIKKADDYISEQFIDVGERRGDISEALHQEVIRRLVF